jgi:hypothetical protein
MSDLYDGIEPRRQNSLREYMKQVDKVARQVVSSQAMQVLADMGLEKDAGEIRQRQVMARQRGPMCVGMGRPGRLPASYWKFWSRRGQSNSLFVEWREWARDERNKG